MTEIKHEIDANLQADNIAWNFMPMMELLLMLELPSVIGAASATSNIWIILLCLAAILAGAFGGRWRICLCIHQKDTEEAALESNTLRGLKTSNLQNNL